MEERARADQLEEELQDLKSALDWIVKEELHIFFHKDTFNVYFYPKGPGNMSVYVEIENEPSSTGADTFISMWLRFLEESDKLKK